MINPTQSAPKHCGARCRDGQACQTWAMPNGRCRMHGGKSPGAPKGNRNAWKHGGYSRETLHAAAYVRALSLFAKKISDLKEAGPTMHHEHSQPVAEEKGV